MVNWIIWITYIYLQRHKKYITLLLISIVIPFLLIKEYSQFSRRSSRLVDSIVDIISPSIILYSENGNSLPAKEFKRFLKEGDFLYLSPTSEGIIYYSGNIALLANSWDIKGSLPLLEGEGLAGKRSVPSSKIKITATFASNDLWDEKIFVKSRNKEWKILYLANLNEKIKEIASRLGIKVTTKSTETAIQELEKITKFVIHSSILLTVVIALLIVVASFDSIKNLKQLLCCLGVEKSKASYTAMLPFIFTVVSGIVIGVTALVNTQIGLLMLSVLFILLYTKENLLGGKRSGQNNSYKGSTL